MKDLFAPTANEKCIKLSLALTVALGLVLQGFDVYGAFLVPTIERPVYVTLPKIITGGKSIKWKLKKTLYGLADSPRQFYLHVSKSLEGFGFIKSVADSCVFIKRFNDKEFISAVIYVDDFIVISADIRKIDMLKDYLNETYEITVQTTVESFLGIHIQYTNDGRIKISQPGYIKQILEDNNMLKCNACTTPMSSTFNDEYQNNSPTLSDDEHEIFLNILGCLIYLLKTRPDISYAVNRLATRSTKTTVRDMEAIKRILRYIKGTVSLGIIFKPSKAGNLTRLYAWVDAAYATHSDGKSHTGYCFSIGESDSGMFYSRSTKQSNVTLSSAEAETSALTEVTKEIEWFRLLLFELGFHNYRLQ
jgi:hypothetical protein